MATGTEISSVFCEPALIRFWSRFSQYSRAADAALLRQPVQREVVQHFVSRRRLLGVLAVRPLGESRVHEHPPREAGRRVRQAVADGLRPRAHHRHVGHAAVLRRTSSGRRLPRVPARRVRPARARRQAPRRLRSVSVAGKLVWMPSRSGRRLPSHRLDDARAPISALRDVARVPQPLHEDVPRTADALRPPARLGRPPPRSRSQAATESRRRRHPRPGRRTSSDR